MSGGFCFIMLEVPTSVTPEYLGIMRERVNNIDFNIASIINDVIKFDLDEVDLGDDLKENDLFHLGEEKLKIKKACIKYLSEALATILIPRLNHTVRIGTPIHSLDFCYLEICNKTYVVSGEQQSYYGTKKISGAYGYIVSLNLAGIFNE